MQKIRRIFENFSLMKRKKLSRERKINLIIIIIICISLLVFSVVMKNFFSQLYWREHNMDYGWGFYWTHFNTTTITYDNGTVVTYENINEITAIWYIEAYSDSSHYYEPYLYSFRFKNWNPYEGGTYEKDPLNGYAYGPMFIYGLYIISLFVSLFNPGMSRAALISNSVKWTHIVFDSFCVIMLYLVIISLKSFKEKKIKKHSFGFLGATVFLFMPINLLYVDSLYLNTPQMTFFTLLCFLLFIKEKYRSSAFFLAIAWLSKQMPLFLLIPWFLIIWKKDSLKKALLDFVFPFLVTTFLISLPWLFMSPYSYIWRVFGPGKPLATVDLSLIRNTVTLAHTIKFLGKPGFATTYAKINSYMIPFFAIYVIIVLISYFRGNKIGNDESVNTIFTSWILIGTHLFISRGVYKYYNAFLTPFVILSFLVFLDTQISSLVSKKMEIRSSEEKKEKGTAKERVFSLKLDNFKEMLLFLSFILSCAVFYYWNWVVIVKDRNLHPLFLLVLFVVISVLIPSDLYRSLITKQSYKMIKLDVIEIYKQSIQWMKEVKERIQTKRLKTKLE